MAHKYTPSSTLHPTLVVPDDGDKATAASVNVTAFQYLADNDAYLEATKVDGVTGATYTPTGAITVRGDGMDVYPLVSQGVHVGDVLSTFALYNVEVSVTSGRADLVQVINNGGFSLSSNRVTVPAAGTYEIQVSLIVQNTDTGSQTLSVSLEADTTLLCNTFQTVVGSGQATLARSTLLVVTTPGSQRINVVYGANTAGIATDSANTSGKLVIRRIL